MEEKERYELFGEFGIIHDTSPNAECMLLNKFQTCEILNRQDKRIKELEQGNRQLKDQARKAYQEGLLQKQFDKDMEIQELKDKIETLKQSQKQLAIEELEKLREYIVLNDEYDEEIGCNIIKTFDLIEDLADKIKSLKGEE